MAKKDNLCGRAHGLLDEIFGCSRCDKEKKRLEKKKKSDAVNRANDQTHTFKGWRTDSNWSKSKKSQFPRGLPPEDD